MDIIDNHSLLVTIQNNNICIIITITWDQNNEQEWLLLYAQSLAKVNIIYPLYSLRSNYLNIGARKTHTSLICTVMLSVFRAQWTDAEVNIKPG